FEGRVSGFAGLVSADGAIPDSRLLERIAVRLEFRGPDGTHVWAEAGAGMCFTFLRTGPAPQCPSQPWSLDGRVWLLGEVRLDGREELRSKLEQHGAFIPPDAPDEQLVLQFVSRYNAESLPELDGDLSLVLWEPGERRLIAYRDLSGARPFFYSF